MTDTEETSALIEWMRQYNENPRHLRKVKFYGVDMQFPLAPFQVVMAYLSEVDAGAATRARVQLQPLVAENEDDADSTSRAERSRVCKSAADLVASFNANRAAYVAAAGQDRWIVARQNAVVLSQACALWSGSTNSSSSRDKFMALNLEWILKTEGPDTRVLLWAHNSHVATASDGWFVPAGVHLRSILGSDYVAVGQFFNRGRFRAWNMQEREEANRSVVPIDVEPAPSGYVENGLAKIGVARLVLDLRKVPRRGPAWEWLSTPHPFRDISAAYLDEESVRTLLILTDSFDAIVFIDEVEATRPKSTGLRGPLSH